MVDQGIRNIELSGGTNYYEGFEKDLLRLQDKHDINYLVHNYFPPPNEHFVLNLASLDDSIVQKSLDLCQKAINLSRLLGSNKYAVHAGFLIDIPLRNIGSSIPEIPRSNRQAAIERLSLSWQRLQEMSGGTPELYIENNVLSSTNYVNFRQENPFLFTNYDGYLELRERIEFKPLIDLAHLRVSSKTLGLDFLDELRKHFLLTNYFHVSENDGNHDQNRPLYENGLITQTFREHNFDNTIITLEIYGSISEIVNSASLATRYVTHECEG
jgi:sugar phosphate isomerase/epimerase